MKLEPFELERWLSTHVGKYNFAGVNPPPITLGELADEIDPQMALTYGPTRGSQKLREEVASLYSSVTADEVLVTNGTAEANFLVGNVLLEEGDDVIITIPTYLQFLGITRACGAKVSFAHLREEDGFKLDLDEMNRIVSSKTKAIFVTNPNNPTGAVLSERDVRAVCEIAEDKGAYVIFDEVIRGLELDGGVSLSSMDAYEKGISTASLSKLGLLGLRIGWVAARREITERCWSYKDYSTLSHSGLSEHLATIALQKGKIEELREKARGVFRRNLKILRSWIEECNEALSCVVPKAGASAFPKYNFDRDAREICEKLLEQEGILLSPGDYFGSPKHFRIRYGGHNEQTLTQIFGRIRGFLRKQR